ncbi:beta-N-acetylhexosaminidase [Haploplasma axanthum]|nr:beta-N-acetylhexosaminidase [Haploplasma axanthum]
MIKYDLSKMTLRDKIGQLAMFGFDGTTVTDDLINMVKKYKLGNVILFARNIKTPEQLYNLTKNIQKLAIEEIGFPMFISIDQEGGMVTRIFNGATFFPGAMTISATNNPNNAYEVGKAMGIELDALGINMNLAPVYDVNNNPNNPVIGVRSFSDKPDVVSEYANSFMKGLQEQNVFATAKHFPGHGDTNIDSHLGLPIINHDLKRLNEIEFKPFISAINNGIKAIMSTHINFTKLTNDGYPATLSKDIMTGLLREKFGFEGLIVSDGMGMKGVVDKYTTEEACVLAIKAGINLICVCHSHEPRHETFETIYRAVEEGRITIDEIDERVKRVLEAKKEINIKNIDNEYETVKKNIENTEHQKLAYSLVENAITLVKGNPFNLKEKTLYIGIIPRALTIADDDIKISKLLNPIYNIKNLDVIIADINPDYKQIEELVSTCNKYNQIIFTTYNSNTNIGQINLIESISELKKDFHVVSLRNPYDLYYTKSIMNYVCLYEYTPNSIKVLSKYLKGEISLNGRIPIKYE